MNGHGRHKNKRLNFALIGLVDVFFAAVSIIIVLIVTLNKQTQPISYIPQSDLTLICNQNTTETIGWHYKQNPLAQIALSDLEGRLFQLSQEIERPNLRIQVLFYPDSIMCYQKLQEWFKSLERSKTLNLFFSLSWQLALPNSP